MSIDLAENKFENKDTRENFVRNYL